MVKVIFIIAQKNFRDEELIEPKKILEESGHQTDIASITSETCIGMLGARVKPTATVKEALLKWKDYAAVVVCGGSGSPELASYPEVLEILKKFDESNKLVASICLGGTVLAKARVLEGRRATVWSSSAYQQSVRILKDNGAKYTGSHLEVDKNTITAFGPDDAHRFGNEIRDWLDERY